MSWFSRRSRRGSEALGNDPPPGVHRSPGLAMLFDELERRRSPAVLDLGPSVTENVTQLSHLTSELTIQDSFRSSGGAQGQRAEVFRFSSAESISLPDEEGGWDAILMWDLVHYVERDQAGVLGARLGRIARPGAILYLIASATAPIPTSPIPFRILSRDRLSYEVDPATSVAPPQFRAREIEGMLADFEPRRLFQLRSGLMEMLFARRDDGPSGG